MHAASLFNTFFDIHTLFIPLPHHHLHSLKMKKSVASDDSSWNNYDKIEKSESMRIEIRSKKARRLIEETLKVADSPKTTKSYSF
ncbi:hypothetical protein L1887_31626 [Cichorium endivia]|nr:hypothetical protein L1887_31626 [Cichorium endivia]